ncbi:MAG TPA: glycosyltransferase family 39 protein [Candidatus Obscuribacterales bacterium]
MTIIKTLKTWKGQAVRAGKDWAARLKDSPRFAALAPALSRFKAVMHGLNETRRRCAPVVERISPYWAAILVFAIAISVRFTYILNGLEHRIAEFGDAHYYLTTGSLLARAFLDAPHPAAFFQALAPQAVISPEATQAFVSTSLPQRLLLDGPVYTTYLAALAALFGFAGATSGFDNYTVSLALANAFIDSLSCLLVYLIARSVFGRPVGLLSALFLAFYPAAVINTARCFSEPFAYFVLLAFLYVLVRVESADITFKRRCCLAFVLGILTGLATLARPAFLLITVTAAVAALAADRGRFSITHLEWLGKWKAKERSSVLIAAAAGALLIFVPWCSFTRAGTGQPTLMISRAPAYNLFIGNQIASDGWKTWPVASGFPGDLPRVKTVLFRTFVNEPGPFVALQLKKLARLWAGEWNEFQYPLFGISFSAQNLLHQLLLLSAFLGACLVAVKVADWRSLPLRTVGLILIAVPLLHFVYCLFEPTSRYAVTAMPFVCILSAFGIFSLWRDGSRRLLLLVLAAGALLFYLCGQYTRITPLLLTVIPASGLQIAHGINIAFWLTAWITLAVIAFLLVASEEYEPPRNVMACLVAAGFGLASTAWFCCAAYDPSWREWHAELRSKQQTVVQRIRFPAADKLANEFSEEALLDAMESTAFLLIDFKSETLAPYVRLFVNKIAWDSIALPWYQVRQSDPDIASIMNMQGSAMGQDWRGFRQWWAIPFPAELVNFGEENEFAFSFEPKQSFSGMRVYGDYMVPGKSEQIPLPSLESFSWTKGFATYDVRDPRVYEKTRILGQTVKSSLWFRELEQDKDISLEHGKQFGDFRLRVALPFGRQRPSPPESVEQQQGTALPPPDETDYSKYSPVTFYNRYEQVTVNGADPSTFQLFPKPYPLPAEVEPGSILEFSCEQTSGQQRISGPIIVAISGKTKDGEEKSLTSPWRPTAVHSEAVWHHFSCAEVIPPELVSDLKVQVMVSPFQVDNLYLHKARATRDVIALKNIQLTLYTPIRLPREGIRWLIF